MTQKDKAGGSNSNCSLNPTTVTTTTSVSTTKRTTIRKEGDFSHVVNSTAPAPSLMDMLSEIDPLDLGFTRGQSGLLLLLAITAFVVKCEHNSTNDRVESYFCFFRVSNY